MTDVKLRLRRLAEILARELEVIQLGSKIQSQVQSEIEKGQREYYLREQMKAIQQELGEEDEHQAEVNELRERIEAAELPEHAQKAADRELARLERLPSAAAEYGVIRTYLEWLVELPWSKTTDGRPRHRPRPRGPRRRPLRPREGQGPDPRVPGGALADEQAADSSASPPGATGGRGAILCFVGPPGVGKTSLGQSIARALGREFERISVGGVRDEAEIRGHRRTYIGAMPGTIVRALRDAGLANPVFMIDEIDKMGSDFRGDPSSAMLEVLDPAQNDSFRDHYLDLSFDLSEVMFIATANTLDTVPTPLLDRMEVIQLAGYTLDEKLHIAKRYLVPRQIDENGLKQSQIVVLRRRAAGDRRRVHPRGGGAKPRARDRQRLSQARARGRRGQVERQAGRLGEACARAARPTPLLRRDRGGGPRTQGSRPGWPGRRSAARCCSSRRPRCRAAGG